LEGGGWGGGGGGWMFLVMWKVIVGVLTRWKVFWGHQTPLWSPKRSAVGSSFLWNTVIDLSDYTASHFRTVLLHSHGSKDLGYYKFIELFWFIWVACKSLSTLFLGFAYKYSILIYYYWPEDIHIYSKHCC
jgi:hypothetical protein